MLLAILTMFGMFLSVGYFVIIVAEPELGEQIDVLGIRETISGTGFVISSRQAADSNGTEEYRNLLDEAFRSEGILRDQHGDPIRMPDGSAFPAGSRFDEAGNIVTPSGDVYKPVAAEGWSTQYVFVDSPGSSGAAATIDSDLIGGANRAQTVAAVQTASETEGRQGQNRQREVNLAEITDENTRDNVPPELRGAVDSSKEFPQADEFINPLQGIGPNLDVTDKPEDEIKKAQSESENPLPEGEEENNEYDPYEDWVDPFASENQNPEDTELVDESAESEEDKMSEEEEIELVTQHGLRGDYFDFLDGQIREIPELETIPPSFSRIDLSIDFENDESFALPFVPETFATLWRGYLYAPEAGNYNFVCGSDDGIRMIIDGVKVLEHAGLRPYGETSGSIELTEGFHEFQLVFYENYVYASCRLFWQTPTLALAIIDPKYFSPPTEIADVIQPHVTQISPASAKVGAEITLRGIGFSDIPTFNRVTFNGADAEIIEAQPNQLKVVVPVGAITGDVVVQVGPLSSLPKKFEVLNLIGLYAEYFRLAADLSEYPPFEEMAPYFVRLEPNLDFHRDNLWNLPYEPDIFAARYSGFLYFPEDADYTIWLGSDDGCRVDLDGGVYLEDTGLHAYREKERTSHFFKGFHPINIIFFENRGVARLRLFWQKKGDQTRSVIPAGYYFAPEALASAPTPQIGGIDLEAADWKEEINIFGLGFGVDPKFVRVLFPGDVWVRPDAAFETRLVVKVPYGTTNGDIRVEVGIKKSLPFPFRTRTQSGLIGDYYIFGSAEEVAAMASKEAILSATPTFARHETGFAHHSQESWNFEYPKNYFIAHWHGTLALEYDTDIGFILQADYGAYLFVDDEIVIDMGPAHGMIERYGSRMVGAGEHQFDVIFIQSDASARIDLMWTPRGKAEHYKVPSYWFLPRDIREPAPETIPEITVTPGGE
ncbi:MAG: PA14 domain-containing protein [Planctomycetes bacterium]|nr:PA14 domain-containing protein [Planctomycetota bacterium]